MKDKLNNVMTIIKDNNKIIVPSIVIIVLLIIIFITLYFYKYNSYHRDEELVFYNYVTATKNEFEGVLSRNRFNEIISLNVDDVIIGSYPIYNKKNNIVIFPSSMNVVYAANELKQAKTNDYSYLYYDINSYKLIDDGYNANIGHSFLYDGGNIYFFVEATVIKIDKEEIELSPLSFVIANYRNNINYYDYEKDLFVSKDYTGSNVEVSNKYYKVNVMEDMIDYYGNEVLLINDLDYLNFIGDKK